ncbi:MAG: acetolactate synthase large subunit [Hyphomonadaceae bacterium]
MNGAQALIQTLASAGVRVCFANPGTTEMHLVAALDGEVLIRPVLCLFEGVATGAADGFARMTGEPAMTLLHLGPGYLNGGANIHNLRRARVPAIHVIGDHATYHHPLDPPLAADIEALVAPMAAWTVMPRTAGETGHAAAEAWAASFGPPAGNAFVIVPADAAWEEGGASASLPRRAAPAAPDPTLIAVAAEALRAARKPAVLAAGSALLEDGLAQLARLAAVGVRVLQDTFPARADRGARRFAPERLTYFPELAQSALAEIDALALLGSTPPVAFFAYPGKANVLAPAGARMIEVGGPEIDSAAAAGALADALGAPAQGEGAPASEPPAVSGPLNAYAVATSLARRMPEGAIVCDDGVTSAFTIHLNTAGAARHTWLYGAGGAIGEGMPLAIGAAVARPDAKVICLAGDGAAAYTLQSLWTMARERLDILTIVFANRAYMVLNVEMMRAGAAPGEAARKLFSLGDPPLDWVKLAEGQGVHAVRSATAGEFDAALARLLAQPGPKLIEAVF